MAISDLGRAWSRGFGHTVFHTSPKRERGKLVFCPSLALRASVRPCAIRAKLGSAMKCLFAVLLVFVLLSTGSAKRPNVVLVMTDDQGNSHGAYYVQIERLARSPVRPGVRTSCEVR